MKFADMEQDVAASLKVDISRCESVCLMLGPYRNLTTLTAAVLFLHPNCQVLNHGGMRIFNHPKLDFLAKFSPARLEAFIRFAIWVSAKGERGDHGGSVTLSHAFEAQHPMQNVYQRRGGPLLKPDIRCLFWKESQRTTNILRQSGGALDRILVEDRRLRFVLPIRNPLDCAVSNLKTGHVEHLPHLTKQSSTIEVVRAILDEILWFVRFEMDHSDRFFSFFEHDMNRNMFARLATFLGLEPKETWLGDAAEAAQTRGGYNHGEEIVGLYREYVVGHFKDFPDVTEGLLAFVESNHERGL